MVNGTLSKSKQPAKQELPEPPKPSNLELMQDKTKPITTRMASFENLLNANMGKLSDCIPEGCGLTAQRMMRLVLGSFRLQPKLLDCTAESIFLAINEAATLGLQLDGTLGHAYLIPYKEECKLMPGYKGLIDLARRKDKILLKTRCVYKGDQFEYQEGDDDFIRHVPDQSGDSDISDNAITHVYLIAKDAETKEVICRNVWSRKRIEKHKEKYSKAWKKDDNPWKTAWSSMARKTLIRDSIARGELPVSVEIQKLASSEEQHEAKFFEAPQPVKRTTIEDIGSLLENKGTKPQKGSSAPVPDDVIESAFEDDEIPFGADLPSQTVEEESESEIVQDDAGEVEAEDDGEITPLLIQEGESPRQWSSRIGALIAGAKSPEILDSVIAAIDHVAGSGSVSEDMINKLQSSWASASQRFVE